MSLGCHGYFCYGVTNSNLDFLKCRGVLLGLIHAITFESLEGMYLLDSTPITKQYYLKLSGGLSLLAEYA